MQVGIGALGGKLAVWIVEGRRKKKPGWHPLNPTKSADRIAQSTAMASMIPLASDALLPDPDSSPKGKLNVRNPDIAISIPSQNSVYEPFLYPFKIHL